jgi:hypothetical protein
MKDGLSGVCWFTASQTWPKNTDTWGLTPQEPDLLGGGGGQVSDLLVFLCAVVTTVGVLLL